MTVNLPIMDQIDDALYSAKIALNGKMEDAWQWRVDLIETGREFPDVVISFIGLRPNAQGITQEAYTTGQLGGVEGQNFIRNFGTIIRMDAHSAMDFYASIKAAINDIPGLGDRP